MDTGFRKGVWGMEVCIGVQGQSIAPVGGLEHMSPEAGDILQIILQ